MQVQITDYFLVAGLVAAALAAIASVRILRSVIGLAVASVLLTLIMFRLGSPMAAVFELSVCAGLIPAIFISSIGMTGRTAPEEMGRLRREKIKRYWLLPVLMILAVIGLAQVTLPKSVPSQDKAQAPAADVRSVLWTQRQSDLIGQAAVLMAGALGVVVLVKERKHGS